MLQPMIPPPTTTTRARLRMLLSPAAPSLPRPASGLRRTVCQNVKSAAAKDREERARGVGGDLLLTGPRRRCPTICAIPSDIVDRAGTGLAIVKRSGAAAA